MSGLDDYLLCPALDRWLPARLGPGTTWWSTLRRAPSAVRRVREAVVVARDDPDDPDDPDVEAKGAATGGLLVLARLDEPVDAVPPSVLASLRPGALVADVCLPPRRGPLEWVSGELRSRRLHAATARRLAGWLARGLHDVEQWVAVDPADAIVTIGRARGRG